jgi:hypothetical protein
MKMQLEVCVWKQQPQGRNTVTRKYEYAGFKELGRFVVL